MANTQNYFFCFHLQKTEPSGPQNKSEVKHVVSFHKTEEGRGKKSFSLPVAVPANLLHVDERLSRSLWCVARTLSIFQVSRALVLQSHVPVVTLVLWLAPLLTEAGAKNVRGGLGSVNPPVRFICWVCS